MNLPNIKTNRKTGNENFVLKKKVLNIKIQDFWCWNQSNLIENRTRGILAEFIVKEALNIKSQSRIEWDYYDLITDNGTKIEVKSAAYIQSWKQRKYSAIKFSISKTVNEPSNCELSGKIGRSSDYYVFCLLKTKDQDVINPIDLDQWTFFVLKTDIINEKLQNQKTIGLNSLLKLNPVQCNYNQLKDVII